MSNFADKVYDHIHLLYRLVGITHRAFFTMKIYLMDKNFKPIEQLYLSQAFNTDKDDEQMLTECKMVAQAYALAENAVVSMGDNHRNCSYCYFGGVADILGIPQEKRISLLPSLYEDFIFDRCHPDDLSKRHAEEIAFLHYIANNSSPENYRDYVLCNYLRVKDASEDFCWVKHRMIPLATDKNGCLRLCICIYTLATDENRKTKFANTRTGMVRILTNKDYDNILSERELEVLRLIDQGLLSKEIANNLCISINTVNRHRQNILQKMKVNRTIEACKLAHVMGLF